MTTSTTISHERRRSASRPLAPVRAPAAYSGHSQTHSVALPSVGRAVSAGGAMFER